MDWTALGLSFSLAWWTCALLLPAAVLVARRLAAMRSRWKGLIEAAIALPLVLPPTVLGYYLLVGLDAESLLGQIYAALSGRTLVFSFDGLLLASIVFNLPFAVQPVQRAFEAVPADVREAAWVSGMSRWRTFWTIELPLAWPGLVTGFALTFAHTLGEFGVVLMVGGNIEGETRTVAIAIYDRMQAFDDAAAGAMSALLLAIAFLAIAVVYVLAYRGRRRHA